ncbi:hypothetical protein SAMN05444920_107349 [Nonomuraea solani]|uniref:Uncharacterized protein n=1 Tax=Nonomuraea solani TaxID=1144553 RepID=A0A1H6E428_9ACTN|nr:hypothetical protein [Nonomuraea solani]SEG91784.1 hypothetical protein SAMN05444920_107349 [Nonomuraea solani]
MSSGSWQGGRPLEEACFRQVASLLALMGSAGNLLARRLSELRGDGRPFERWWPDVRADRTYWACLTHGDPAPATAGQLALACLLLGRGLHRRGTLLIRLARPFADPGTLDVLGELIDEVSWRGGELAAALEPGLAAHDRGDHTAALENHAAVAARWPNDPWPRHEQALALFALDPAPATDAAQGADRARHPAVVAALERDPFYYRTLLVADPERAELVRTSIEPVTENDDLSPAALVGFADAAARIDPWSAAHARVLLGHLGIPQDLRAALGELGIDVPEASPVE